MRLAHTDRNPLCAISAVALLAGHPKDFSQQCLVGRLQAPVLRECVEALLLGILAQREQLQQLYQRAHNIEGIHCSQLHQPCGHPYHAG